MKTPGAMLGYAAIGAIGLALGCFAFVGWQRDYEEAKAHFVANASADSHLVADKMEGALRSIYENIRTLALLLSVRTISRHGENLSAEAHETFQQVYNNLASNVSVSEVYILPADLDPEKIDPVTGEPEEPPRHGPRHVPAV